LKKKKKNTGFADRLNTVRIIRGLTRAEVADKLGLNSSSQLSRYETGQAFPAVPALQQLARILDIDLHWLITGTRSPNVMALTAAAHHYLVIIGQRRREVAGEITQLELGQQFKGEDNRQTLIEKQLELDRLKTEYVSIMSIMDKGAILD